MKRLACFVAVSSILALFAILQPDADGCAAVGRDIDGSIHIADESAIIVWDPVKKIQHFIRRAAFDTKATDFGFLVPTPSVPRVPLGEVGDAVFSFADGLIVPKVVDRTRYQPGILCCLPLMLTKSARMAGVAPDDAKGDVRILAEQKVGGFETTILEADSPKPLADWLKEKGYSQDESLESWLAPYLGAGWKITAFKISQDPAERQLATTKAVRMSFQTDRPFFPYREPERKVEEKKDPQDPHAFRDNGRRLRVHFVSATRMEGKLGEADWHAKVKWADKLDDKARQRIIEETGVPEDELPANAWLTTFDDTSSPRPGKVDVYFGPARDQSPVHPPDTIRYHDVLVPIDCLVVALILIALLVWLIVRLSRRRAKASHV